MSKPSETAAYDLVLIDDDVLVHKFWKIEADKKGHHLLAVASLAEFETYPIPVNVPVYIDRNLAAGEYGIEVAKKLHNKGFTKLYIASGDELHKSELPDFLLGFGSKDYPL